MFRRKTKKQIRTYEYSPVIETPAEYYNETLKIYIHLLNEAPHPIQYPEMSLTVKPELRVAVAHQEKPVKQTEVLTKVGAFSKKAEEEKTFVEQQKPEATYVPSKSPRRGIPSP